MPIRVQRKRVKGWKMPDNTVSVTRPGKYGNMWKIGDQVPQYIYNNISEEERQMFPNFTIVDAAGSLLLFERFQVPSLDLQKLKGKDLACFCDLHSPCHADVLLKLANQ